MILLERAGYQTVGFDRRNFMMKPQSKIAKMLNICADNAGGGLRVVVLRAESGDDLHLPTAHPSDRMSEGARDTAPCDAVSLPAFRIAGRMLEVIFRK